MKNKGLIIGAIAIVGAVIVYNKFFKENEEEEVSEEMSNFGGRRRRRKFDKAKSKMESFCRRHPDSPQCGGMGKSVTPRPTSCKCKNGVTGMCQSGDCSKCCGSYGYEAGRVASRVDSVAGLRF